jgi:hypothetical protein
LRVVIRGLRQLSADRFGSIDARLADRDDSPVGRRGHRVDGTILAKRAPAAGRVRIGLPVSEPRG